MAHRYRTLIGLLALLAAMLPALPRTAAAEEVYPRPADGIFRMEGHGWGHGHGMSQWGAYGAATRGLSSTDITSFYYPGTALGSLPNGSIRVRLTGDEGVDTVVRAASGLRAGDWGRSVSIALPAGPALWRAVKVSGGLALQYVSVTTGQWTTYPLAGASVMPGPVVFYGPATVRLVFPNASLGDYRASVRATLSGSTLYTLATMPMEDYLRGVVPRESPSSWSAAALEAQAIAARTYAAFEMRSRASSAYDICDSTSCQVFGGTAQLTSSGSRKYGEEATTDAAIRATAGRIRTYGGVPIFAQFSASNGGYSTDGGQPYLLARPDPYDGVVPNSAHSWTTGLPAVNIERRHTSIGSLLRIRVLTRDGHGDWGGRVTRARLEGSRGYVDVDGYDLYYACPYGGCSGQSGMKGPWWRSTITGPTSPHNLRVVGQDQKVFVDWDPPATAGSSPLSSYTVTASPGGRSVTVPASITSATVYGLPSGTAYTMSVLARSAVGTGPAAVSVPVTPGWVYGDLHLVTPTRLLDTRRSRVPVTGGHEVAVRVDGVGGVPTGGVNAVALTVTVTSPTTNGYATVYATGEPRPASSTMSYTAGRTVASGMPARVGVGPGGYVSVWVSSGSAHVIVDLVGYYSVSAPGVRFVPLPAQRVADTRLDPPGVLGQDRALDFDVSPAVPAWGTAAVVNLTGIGASATTFLTAWQSGQPRPSTSALNVAPGETRAATAIVPLGPERTIAVYNRLGTVGLTVDVLGYYTGSTLRGRYAATLPTRVLDTRQSAALGSGGTATVRVAGLAGVPTHVLAVQVALTGVTPTHSTFFTAYPSGSPVPGVSHLNVAAGTTATNVVVVPTSPGGYIGIRNAAASAHLLVDVLGWYTP